ncbi:unnamed protein product, partial [Urochloa humidicola]
TSSSRLFHSATVKRAKKRRSESRRRFRRFFSASGGRVVAGGGEELRERRPMYITYPSRISSLRLGLVSSMSVGGWSSIPCPSSEAMAQVSAWFPAVEISGAASSVDRKWRPEEFYLPSREIGLVVISHRFWWFPSHRSGWLVGRCVKVVGD